ncbi:MAG: alpha/beta fold hydrolase, partial [Gammaproteobacteria bacterium]
MTSLHYTEQGEGRPLVILHGLFGSGRNWQRVARRLAEHYRVITPDLRNHGRSPHLPGMSYPEMAADLFELMERLDLPSTLLMGHSMGGKVAMTAALQQPEKVTALIVVDIAPVRYRHSFEPIFQALKSIPVEWIRSRQEAERLLAGYIDDSVLRAFLLQNLNRDESGFHWRINLDA